MQHALRESYKESKPTTEGAALLIAHPGHELCVYGWLEAVRPYVFVLTDGSGRTGRSRLNSTTEILSSVEAQPGALYGRFTDHSIYAAILGRDFGLFEQLAEELALHLVRAEIRQVAGDAMEGYNPVHDVFRLVTDAAVGLACRMNGCRIINRDFLLFGRHDAYAEVLDADSIRIALDDGVFARKLAVARAYPELRGEVEAALDKKMLETLQSFPELRAQTSGVIETLGTNAYRVECLRLVRGPAWNGGATGEAPFYERYGELLVAAGVYEQAIRYGEHIAPLAEALRRFVGATH